MPGALVGGLAGHFALDRVNDRQVIFTIAMISLAAKMTRADGDVSPIEVQAVQDMMRVPESRLKNMERVFRLAQEDVTGFDSYARQVKDIMPTARKCWKMCWTCCFTLPMPMACCIRQSNNFWRLLPKFLKLMKVILNAFSAS